ncbi:hypothetical protein NLG97_g9266 [Lecanicillium saksenae]|uniref:Uncharacterized protein n=1 Tax=Lecanicillium saksenae TaxID=468837 RepID=A0ACC1QH21_9HYPO|nr:hypothetical protein NLG97_g9266 [Lecanicillium saksenae]
MKRSRTFRGSIETILSARKSRGRSRSSQHQHISADAWNYTNLHHLLYGAAVIAFWVLVVAVGFFHRLYLAACRVCYSYPQLQLIKLPLGQAAWLKRRLFLPAAFGYRCAQSAWGCTVPPRIQSLSILAFVTLNTTYSFIGYRFSEENYYFGNIVDQALRYASDRTGIISFANFPLIWLFGMRNNFALWLTGWDFGTYNNFHRWTARIATLQAVIHSIGYIIILLRQGGWRDLYTEFLEPYWQAGVLSRWQSHPFTVASFISSIPDLEVGERTALLTHGNFNTEVTKAEVHTSTGSLRFLIRPYDGFTAKLRELAQDKTCFQVQLDGPYGTSHNLHTYSHVVFIAGGTGIVTPISYLPTLVGNPDRKPVVTLHWAVREPAFADLVLQQYYDDALRSDNISITLYASACIDLQPMFLDFISQQMGRPNICSIIASAASTAENGRLAVVACGPEGLDTGHGDQCCDNDSYCFVSTSGESRCCPLGSNCVADSKCNSKSYYCTRTTTRTLIASILSNATETGCCGRRCPQSQYYLCPAELGGNCCPYGAACRADGNCVAPGPTTTTISTMSPSVSPASTCLTGECTGVVVAVQPSGGLSTTTKACIAAIVVGGTGIAAGALTWLWLLKKKRRLQERRGISSLEESPVSEVPGDDVAATEYFGIGAALPVAERAVPSQPQTPGDITSPVEIDSAVRKDDSPDAGNMARVEDAEIYELEATEVRQSHSVEPAAKSEECKR